MSIRIPTVSGIDIIYMWRWLCLCVSVWNTLQSGCLLLAVRCGLINSDRLPRGPTTYMSSKGTRKNSHCRESPSLPSLNWLLLILWWLPRSPPWSLCQYTLHAWALGNMCSISKTSPHLKCLFAALLLYKKTDYSNAGMSGKHTVTICQFELLL